MALSRTDIDAHWFAPEAGSLLSGNYQRHSEGLLTAQSGADRAGDDEMNMQNAPFQLSTTPKEQVSLLYHFGSLECVKGLQQRLQMKAVADEDV
ncbi:hypothetical protein GTP45_27020 [Pseudoduganella sp. FT55W]|uniref:Uncharacterized protein n=1 Tax=Duganella rivi TaxID=2666083 RepID=A0A7X4KEW4_9BURK|nr:hypothetical protein [Duganella rivi]MYM70432.1 hypothetical protein [Duganella rivi]